MKLWVNVAEPDVSVPVTVSEYVPAGVPGLWVTAAPLPPQPGIVNATSSSTNSVAAARRNLAGRVRRFHRDSNCHDHGPVNAGS